MNTKPLNYRQEFKRNTRDIIHDTHASHIIDGEVEVANTEQGNSIQITQNEFKALRTEFLGLSRIIHQRINYPIIFAGTTYNLLHEKCAVTQNSSGSIKVNLVLIRSGDTNQQWISLTYSLYLHNKSGPLLAFIGNPTTLLNGNNLRAVRFTDSKSLSNERLSFYQVGFRFLTDLFPKFVWSKSTQNAIRKGHIQLSNTQWALYIPTKDERIDLALLAGLYCGRLSDRTTSKCLAEYIGFESASVLKGSNGNLSGLFLVRKYNRNHVLTVNFYDKKQSIANKKQGKSLSEIDLSVIANTIRLDITAHRAFLEILIREARKLAPVLSANKPSKTRQRIEEFLAESTYSVNGKMCVEINARNIVLSMYILSHNFDDPKNVQYCGFTPWLLHRVLEKELRLFSLLKGAPETLQVPSTDLAYELFKFWKTYDPKDTDTFREDFKKYYSQKNARDGNKRVLRDATFYEWRNHILKTYGIDVFIPLDYWIDHGFVHLAYGLKGAQKMEFLDAINVKFDDGATALKLLKKYRKLSSNKLSDTRYSLLTSLEVVAKQIPANEVNLKAIGVLPIKDERKRNV